jgi:hypothetical protein
MVDCVWNVMAHAQNPHCLLAKQTSPFKSAKVSVQSTTGSQGVRIGSSNDGYTMFRGSVKGTGYPLHSPGSPSLPLPCVTVCHHVSTGLLNSLIFGEISLSKTVIWMSVNHSSTQTTNIGLATFWQGEMFHGQIYITFCQILRLSSGFHEKLRKKSTDLMFVIPASSYDSNKLTNKMQQFHKFITWYSCVAQQVSGASSPIIRSL